MIVGEDHDIVTLLYIVPLLAKLGLVNKLLKNTRVFIVVLIVFDNLPANMDGFSLYISCEIVVCIAYRYWKPLV